MMATLLLHDEGLDISEQNLKKIIDASGNKVEAQWTKLFAKALAGMNVSTLFASSASAPVGSSAPEEKIQSKKEEKVEEKPKEEPKEEEDMDMGDLFAF